MTAVDATTSDDIQTPDNGNLPSTPPAEMSLSVPASSERRASTSEPLSPTTVADLGRKPTASDVIKAKFKVAVQRCQTMMKDSPLIVLGLSAKHNPKMSEIVDQAKVLCEDYIFGRVLRSGELTGNEDPSEMSDVIKLSDVSREIQLIGARLESTYPQLYQNVSKQVNMPLKTDAAVRRTITSVGDFLFKHGVVTWCRVVALFAVSGAVANECITTGNPDLARVVVVVFSDVISRHAAAWISQQGGWPEIMKAFRLNKTTRTLWILTLLGALSGFVFTWITAMQI